MVRKIAALLSVVFALSMLAGPVAAQTTDAENFEAIGLNSVLMRTYVNTDTEREALGVIVGGMNFEDGDAVNENFDVFACGFVGGFIGSDATDCATLEDDGVTITERDDLGDAAYEFTGEGVVGGETTPFVILMVQDENYVFPVIYAGEYETGDADAMAEYLIDADTSDEPVVLNEDGTSTGGFFDMLPADDDELLTDLEAVQDMDVMGSMTGTPIASPDSTPAN